LFGPFLVTIALRHGSAHPGQHTDQHEGVLQQALEARLHGRQTHEHDHQAEDERYRKSNSKQFNVGAARLMTPKEISR